MSAMLVATVAYAMPSRAEAYGNYQTCVQVAVRTTDSGRTPANISPGETEDDWFNCDAGCSVIARGVRVDIGRSTGGAFQTSYWTDPVTGCVTWSHPDTTGFYVRVYSRARAANQSAVRVHNGGYSVVDGNGTPYPGSTYSTLFTGYNPANNLSDTLTVPGQLDRWTLFAMLAYSLYRVPVTSAQLDGAEVHAGLDTGSTAAASSNFQPNGSGGCSSSTTPCSTSFAGAGDHMVVLGADSGGINGTARSKFFSGHELGHALLRMHSGLHFAMPLSRSAAVPPRAGLDECSNRPFSNPPLVPPLAASCTCAGSGGSLTPVCPLGPTPPIQCQWPNCYVNGYGAYSHRENHSYAIEEGFADWHSASVWNDRTQDQGTFTLFGRAHDLRRYNQGNGTNAGGHLENQCTPFNGEPDPGFLGHSTREDFQRLLWRWRANVAWTCPQTVSVTDVFDVYGRLRLMPTQTQGDNWYWLSQAVLGVEPDCIGTFSLAASYHGVKN